MAVHLRQMVKHIRSIRIMCFNNCAADKISKEKKNWRKMQIARPLISPTSLISREIVGGHRPTTDDTALQLRFERDVCIVQKS